MGNTFYGSEWVLIIIQVVIWVLHCTLADREHTIYLRAANDPSDGASRPDGAQLEAPIGHAFHIHRPLRLQSWSEREAHEIPDRSSHTNDSSCNTWYVTRACLLVDYTRCCGTVLTYAMLQNAMPQTSNSWITVRRQWLLRRCCAPPVRRRPSHWSTLSLPSIGALA